MEYEQFVLEDITVHFCFSGLYIHQFSTFRNGNFCLKDNHSMVYVQNGLLHRDDGPAMIELVSYPTFVAYYFTYYKHGEMHNERGPAYNLFNASKSEPIEERHYLNDGKYSKEEYKKQIITKLYW